MSIIHFKVVPMDCSFIFKHHMHNIKFLEDKNMDRILTIPLIMRVCSSNYVGFI